MPDKAPRILHPGKNCWKVSRAGRAAVLLNGETYFAAFHQAVLNARKQVFIVGWDIHRKVELLRGDAAIRARRDGVPTSLESLIVYVVQRNPDLDVRVLVWDFSMVLSLERDPKLLFNLGWAPQHGIHMHWDNEHPLGASQHQKIVAVDGQVAFCGGLDLSHYRWDTSEHEPDDPRRTTPAGEVYPPYHDAMMIVDGTAAATLAELCAVRWQRATREKIDVHTAAGDAWPRSVQPWFEQVDIGVSRTEPEYKSRPGVREVEALYLDAFRAARHSIFIENQYFASPVVCSALEKRLKEKQGPEVVIILPEKTRGWLGNQLMEFRRTSLLTRLMNADVHKRLRLCHPWVCDRHKVSVMVHAKLLIVDDNLLRVGSSNICNRSLGLDTECDVIIEAHSSRQQADVRRLRTALLAEHSGVLPAEVKKLSARTGSLVRVIDELSAPERTEAVVRGLAPLKVLPNQFPELISEAEILDPEQPLEIDRLMDLFVTDKETPGNGWLSAHWLKLVLGTLALVGVVGVWHFTPLSEFANRENLVVVMRGLGAGWSKYPLIVLGFVIGGLIAFPVTVLIGATAIVLSPAPALITALIGTQSSAVVTYIVGTKLGRTRVQRMAGSRLNRISKHFARHGLISIATVRMLPIAPFTVINYVAGASHIRLGDYMFGTLLGMLPGILAVTIFTDRLLAFLQNPGPVNILIVAAALIFLVLGTKWFTRRFRRG